MSQASEEKKLKWTNLIEQQRQSGLSIKMWCQEHNTPPSTFHYWKEKISPKQLERSSFTEMKRSRAETISLQAKGLYIRIGSECHFNICKQLFALLAEELC